MPVSRKRKQKSKGGRPSLYTPEKLRLASKIGAFNVTDTQLADALGISRDTLYEWKNNRPEFSDTLAEAKQRADARVEKSLFERATGYKHKAVKIFADPKTGAEKIVQYTEHYPPDTGAAEFWLTNRAKDKWTRTQKIDHTITSVSDRMRGILDAGDSTK